MRHRKNRHKLGRTAAHRKRTLQALSTALIREKRIQTTVAKAKALRPFVEPLITRAKEDTTHNRRQVFRRLQDKRAVRELFDEVAVEVGDRPGGYTRVIKMGRRSGDGAERAMIELVDYNDVQPKTGSNRRRTRRSSGGGSSRRSSSASPSETSTETTSQQAQPGGVETEAVETPVAEEQQAPVPERTEAKDEAAADEVVDTGAEAEEAEATAEAEASAEAGASDDAEEAEEATAEAEQDESAEDEEEKS